MEHLTERIQDYIEGLLQGKELEDFENQMQQDVDLRNMVNLQREVYQIINQRLNSDEENLRESLFYAENEVRMSKKTLSWRPLMAIASAACILLVGYLFFYTSSSTLYDMPIMQSEVVRGQEAKTDYEQAVELFNNKSYAEAREKLNTLVALEPDVIQYQYYVALTHLGEKKWTEAIRQLKVIADGESIFKYEAKYYLAISLDKIGEKQEAINVLKEIPQDGKLGEKAHKLLKKLD